MYQAPTICFSYPGSTDLGQLWDGLTAIGWEVPEQPPIPYQASSWTGAGRKERGHEYRVEDFTITAPTWEVNHVADRGVETINLLRRCGVDVHMPITYLDFLRKTQLEQRSSKDLPAAARSPQDPSIEKPAAVVDFVRPAPTEQDLEPMPVRDVSFRNSPDEYFDGQVLARPALSLVSNHDLPADAGGSDGTEPPARPVIDNSTVSIPNIIMLSTKAWSVLESEPGLDVYQSVVVPGRTRWVWSQTSNAVDEIGSLLPNPRILFETIELGWQRSNDDVPAMKMDPDTERTLWFIVAQLGEANELATFMQGHPEVSTRIVPMTPLPKTSAFDDCFLVGAVVPVADFAKVGSKVVSKFPDVIARGKPTPLVGTDQAFQR